MTLNPHEVFELHVLARVERKPVWSQQFPRLKRVVDRLQDEGSVKRVPAEGARIPLMVEITDDGRNRLAALRRKKRG